MKQATRTAVATTKAEARNDSSRRQLPSVPKRNSFRLEVTLPIPTVAGWRGGASSDRGGRDWATRAADAGAVLAIVVCMLRMFW